MKRTENREQSVDQQTLTSVTITVTQPNRESRNRITSSGVVEKYALQAWVGAGGGGDKVDIHRTV